MKIGARILKTGAAVGLALYISQFFRLEPIIFAGIAAAVTVQPSLYRSWQNSWQQVQANIIGAIVGIAMALLLGTQPYVIALGVIIVISINIQLKFMKSIPLAMVTVLAIMGSPSEQFWETAGDRFLLIFIGVVSSILINVFAPPRHEKRLMKQLFDLQESMALNLRIMVEAERETYHVRADLDQLAKQFTELEEMFDLHREENRFLKRRFFRRTRKLVVLRQMVYTCKDGLDTLALLEKHQAELQADEAARQLIDEELQKLAALQERVFLTYAGKLTPYLAHHESITYDELALPIQKALRTFKDNEELLIHILPTILKLNDYREQLEQLDQTVERFLQQNPPPAHT